MYITKRGFKYQNKKSAVVSKRFTRKHFYTLIILEKIILNIIISILDMRHSKSIEITESNPKRKYFKFYDPFLRFQPRCIAQPAILAVFFLCGSQKQLYERLKKNPFIISKTVIAWLRKIITVIFTKMTSVYRFVQKEVCNLHESLTIVTFLRIVSQ